eukprot:TRINITY_DN60832_c0_g1_i2.p1 TRINITY_DN60832_c0_g1~~TRINITY_DN60832_c0_g1_i2.p1  ORF type:complete len:194 (-),score=43.01 TRINITY_DN60832_c0_g1_i2:110-691(-)
MQHAQELSALVGHVVSCLNQTIPQLTSCSSCRSVCRSQQELTELQQKLTNYKCEAVVVGEFKNGKSTFLNALLGRKVLPSSKLPCTASVCRVMHTNEWPNHKTEKQEKPETETAEVEQEEEQEFVVVRSSHHQLANNPVDKNTQGEKEEGAEEEDEAHKYPLAELRNIAARLADDDDDNQTKPSEGSPPTTTS